MANEENSGSSSENFLAGLQERLLGQADIISSDNTQLEEKIQSAITGVSKAEEASSARIESQFGREIGYQREAGAQRLTSAQESQRGFATNNAALKQITEDTEKSVRDLEQRKQELILAGEANAATQISNLQIQALQFEQQSKQQIFSNILAMAGFGLQQQSFEESKRQADRAYGLQERQQNFMEDQQMTSIALEFGLDIKEGENINSLVERAAPLASTKRQLEMDKLRAEINRANAETQKALRGDKFILDSVTGTSLASTIDNLFSQNNPRSSEMAKAMLGSVMEQYGAEGMNIIAGSLREQTSEQFTTENLTRDIMDELNKKGGSLSSVVGFIENNPWATEGQKNKAMELALKLDREKKQRDTQAYLEKKQPVWEGADNPIGALLQLFRK